ncbi:MAG: hypothetical protein POH28_10835 [Acidocella sp.]|nr:hypothetical protein [Acidocella sp.]
MAQEQASTFIGLAGPSGWAGRLAYIRERLNEGTQTRKLTSQRFAAEGALEKARRGQALSSAETALVELATRIPVLYEALNTAGRARLRANLDAALVGDATIMPLLHLIHTARLQEERGFEVSFSGLEQATPYDLLISREGATAEVACDSISAEEGHAVHRSLWTRLIDRIDPDLQTWLAAHPGRYLLKMTLPKGLKGEAESLPDLHRRINEMLTNAKRADYDEAAILRLDPLLLAGAQASDSPPGMIAKLRHEFGPEAHFSVTGTGPNLFVMAARGGTENEVAVAMRRRLAAIAPARLSGDRPGILAMFLDDTDPAEWQVLRDQLLLEGEARQFLTFPEARPVVAVTCTSRYELTKAGAPGGDLRFRNPMHPAAKSAALAPAVLSTL